MLYCYKLFKNYRSSVQNIGKVSYFDPKYPRSIKFFEQNVRKVSYLVMNIRKESHFIPKDLKSIWFCNKIIGNLLVVYLKHSKESYLYANHSKCICFWSKTCESIEFLFKIFKNDLILLQIIRKVSKFSPKHWKSI